MAYNLNTQLKIGQQFELSVKNLLEIKGWVVSLNEAKDLATLRKYDLAIKKDGQSFWVEVKKDILSEQTNNVCIDFDSLLKSESSIFILGLPNIYGTDIFTMPLKSIYQFAKSYPTQRAVGQWRQMNALIPKMEFLRLPFIEDPTPLEPTNQQIRESPEYRQWRLSVLKRDGYRCVWCHATNNLEVDHVYPFAYFPELRFDIKNGRVLCNFHHKQTITYGTGSKKFYEQIINSK